MFFVYLIAIVEGQCSTKLPKGEELKEIKDLIVHMLK